MPNSINSNTRTSFEKSVPLLTKGILDMYMENLLPAKLQINELNKKSNLLYSEVNVERCRFQDLQTNDEIQDFIFQFQFYKTKLISIKNKMSDMNRRVTIIKDRMKKIQQHQDYEMKRKTMLREKEEQLIGKTSLNM